MATERDALTMALARIRWQCHGQRDTVLGDDIPTADATIAAIEAALVAPPVEQQTATLIAPEALHKTISDLLNAAMNAAVENGWDRLTMPEEYVALAAWLCEQPAPQAGTVPVEEYRRVVARCIELGEKIVGKPAPQAGAADLAQPSSGIPTEAGIAWQSGATWPNERKAVTVEGHAWYRHDHPRFAAHPAEQPCQDAEQALGCLNWIDDFIARCNGDDRGACESVNVVRRFIATQTRGAGGKS